MTARADTADRRARIFARLSARNRIVAILRIGVPALGILVFVGLVGQIVMTRIAHTFGILNLHINGTTLNVDTPSYVGVLSDGTTYRISARAAQASLKALDVIKLADARLVLKRPDGEERHISADVAHLQTIDQLVKVPGLAHVSDSEGDKGTLVGAVFDWPTQQLQVSGPVHFDLATGTTLDAASMSYNARTKDWTFSNVTMVLPHRPGEKP